ncbi:MAG: serine/threonine protein kinase, partial [Planctomycetes bacterium]|nr:serine/threonine protein kinase [Planctomycetota bacterium]
MRIAVGLLVFLIGVPLVGGENWPRFRGPDGSGISDEKGVPLHWDEEDFVWKTELPGIGQSS